jgi:hypothetical protein
LLVADRPDGQPLARAAGDREGAVHGLVARHPRQHDDAEQRDHRHGAEQGRTPARQQERQAGRQDQQHQLSDRAGQRGEPEQHTRQRQQPEPRRRTLRSHCHDVG